RDDDGLHMSFHEAALTDYAGMTLKVDHDNLRMISNLVGSDLRGYKVKRALPFSTPWRTIQLSDDAPGLIESTMILNLNEPNKLGDVSWFEPKKYVGIWWEMHVGVSSWDLASGIHGATTENTKRHIDFAAANGIGGVLVEGWNTGWERWIGFPDREGVFDFVTPYPDYDLDEVTAYAKSKGVEIIMHHETSAAPRTYDLQMDTAYQLMQKHDIHSVKTGYVGKIIPDGEYHHGQWMVNHYRRALETAAQHDIAINAHEPIKATGIRRTYPNAISREGLRGQEFNAWASDGGNPTEHLPIVAFTRMLAGPIDFTPGVFNIKLTDRPGENNNQINTTIAQQLALYVVIYSPIQMACDLLKNYEGNPAFQFIRDVGVDWSESKVLNGEVGDYVTIARKERGSERWFVGSITDENAREVEISLDFLDEGKSYTGTIYKDADDSHWDTNPEAYVIETMDLNNQSTLKVNLAPGGGFAVSIIPKDE
ncbi:MAG: glycoside hydrolase family 97 protein, partial [Saprospiraceae bacterium]|nr:glycoside hydrolase family 97 protein [Saprospiraceae bacterium]